MMNVKVRGSIFILVVAALVVAMDAAAMPILSSFYHQPSVTMFLYDFSVVLLAGLAGLFFAPRVGYPYWWRRVNSSPTSRRAAHITVLLGFSLVMGNTLMNLAYRDQAVQLAPWLALLTPEMALAISLRAALNEEIVFRLFLFPSIAWAVMHLVHSQQASLIIGALASTFVYGLIHPGFVMAFLVGLALIYIYHQHGLLPAMTAHFFADAISLVLISLML